MLTENSISCRDGASSRRNAEATLCESSDGLNLPPGRVSAPTWVRVSLWPLVLTGAPCPGSPCSFAGASRGGLAAEATTGLRGWESRAVPPRGSRSGRASQSRGSAKRGGWRDAWRGRGACPCSGQVQTPSTAREGQAAFWGDGPCPPGPAEQGQPQP